MPPEFNRIDEPYFPYSSLSTRPEKAERSARRSSRSARPSRRRKAKTPVGGSHQRRNKRFAW